MDQNQDKKITVEALLEDRKTSINSKFVRIMQFFANTNRPHLEAWDRNVELYEKLGWNKEQHFDVINSFWTVFVCALTDWSNSIKDNPGYPEFWNGLKSSICNGWKCPIFSFGESTLLAYATKFYQQNGNSLTGIGKEKFAQKVIDESNIQYKVIEKFLNKYPYSAQIKTLAALTHTVANFMPCPNTPFNSVKGILHEVYDFFPLMIDWIESHSKKVNDDNQDQTVCDAGKPIIVSGVPLTNGKVSSWKDWFADSANRKNYCLEDYYYISSDSNNVKHIKGIPLFEKQSLEHPLPLETEEVTQCLDEMVKRIKIRAYRLHERQQP